MIVEHPASAAAVCAALAMLVAATLGPLVGDNASFRYSHTGLVVLGVVAWWRRREHWSKSLTTQAFVIFAAGSWAWCAWSGLTYFLALRINGVDFSIFEWMVGSTHQGHFGYSRIYDVNHFGVHSTFLLLLLVPVHALWPSPLVLVLAGATLVWSAIFPLRRLARWAAGGPHGALELTAALAWLGCAWAGKLVNAGFRIEALHPVLTLWLLVGWVERRRWLWVLAAVALWLSKEDAMLFVATFAAGAALVERHRWREGLALSLTSLGALWLYVGVVQPALLGHAPAYQGFWQTWGATPSEVARGVLSQPGLALQKILTSSWWTLLLPALWVPLRSARAVAGFGPLMAMMGLASYDMMYDFLGYYPVPMVAFVLFGCLDVWRLGGRWRVLASVGLLVFPLVWLGFIRSVPFDTERLRGLRLVREATEGATSICAQTILFPHLGVDRRLVPLEHLNECLQRRDTVTVVNPQLDAWPNDDGAFREQVNDWKTRRSFSALPGGFLVFSAPR